MVPRVVPKVITRLGGRCGIWTDRPSRESQQITSLLLRKDLQTLAMLDRAKILGSICAIEFRLPSRFRSK
jgi:hypothetical protein